MYLGRVIGTVVSTSKNEHLVGMKLLVVEKLTERLEREGTSEVAVDSVGAARLSLSARAAPRAMCSARVTPRWIPPSWALWIR